MASQFLPSGNPATLWRQECVHRLSARSVGPGSRRKRRPAVSPTPTGSVAFPPYPPRYEAL